MKKLFLYSTLFFSLVCFSQNEQLAQYYFDKGDFEKAKISFEELLKNQKEPEIIFSGFRLADQTVVPGSNEPLKENLSEAKEINLQYYQNVFSFDFAIIDYANPEQNQLIYQLENYDKNWMQSNAEYRAYYFNVPPGNYTFRVKGVNSYGVWSEKSIQIIINPPWYLTKISIALWVLIGILLLLLLLHFILKWRERIHEVQKIELKLK